MHNRLYLFLDAPVATALRKMSEADLRPPKDQIRFLILAEAQRRGLIGKNNRHDAKALSGQNVVAVAETTP